MNSIIEKKVSIIKKINEELKFLEDKINNIFINNYDKTIEYLQLSLKYLDELIVIFEKYIKDKEYDFNSIILINKYNTDLNDY